MIGSILIFATISWASESPPILSIKEAVSLALKNHPQIQAAREKVLETEEAKRSASAKAWPSFQLNMSAMELKSAANGQFVLFNGDPYSQYKLEITLSQPLYTGGAVSAGIALSTTEKEIYKLELEMAEREMSINVLQLFYSALVQQRQAELLKQVQNLMKQALKITERYSQIGRGQKTDVLHMKSQLALLAPKISQAENKMASAIRQLATFLGISDRDKMILKGSLSPLPTNLILRNTKVDDKNILEIKHADLLVEQARYKSQLDLAKHWPSLNLLGSIGRSAFSQPDLFNEFATSWSFGLQLNVPLFSGLASVHERRMYAAQQAQLALSAQKTYDETQTLQVQYEKDLKVALEMLEGAKAAANYSHLALKEAQRDYRLQISDYLHLINAQQNYLDSMTAYNQAKYDLIMATAKFYSVTGVPILDLVEQLESNPNKED